MWTKQAFLLIFLLITTCECDESFRQYLTGSDWLISNVEGNTSTMGTIPGSIHTALLQSKLIPDPYLGFNDVDLRYLVLDSWIFTKNFSLSPQLLSSDEFQLIIDQIDTAANITLNGCPVGRTNSMFVQYRFDLPRACVKPENQIQIDFESPVIYAYNQSQIYNDTVPPLCPPSAQHGECHVQFIRKEPCSFSWDWGPAFAPIGIPGDIYIEGRNTSNTNLILESINVASYNATGNVWRIDAILSSENNYTFMANLKFVLVNTTWSYETNVTVNRTIFVSMNIPDGLIERWWPNGYGMQTLYELQVMVGSTELDSRTIGFRTVELVQDVYGANINGTSFYFRINNQAIYVKGSNWIPSDAFQERVSDEKLETLLRSAALGHMNMLRIWGGGIYERNSFYDLADKIGIMLWHDFMFACSLYPVNDEFLTNVRNEVIYQVKRLQHHSSIVLWSGNNENEAAVAQNWYGVPPEKMEKVKNDYRQLYVETVMKTVATIDLGDNRPFITSSPTNGKESIKENYIATNPQDPLYGDVHFYGYGDDSWDWRTYPITRFLSETGIQSLPSIDAWYEVTNNQSDLYFNSTLILHREHSGNQIDAMMKHIESNLPLPITNDSIRKFTQMIYLSQINQAMTLKSIGDFCRMHSSKDMIDPATSQGNTMGLMYWQINDIWQAPTWSTIEYGLKWKMSHYYVRHMYEPVNILLNLNPYLANSTDEKAQISIFLVNDLFDKIQGKLICTIQSVDRFSLRLSWLFLINLDGSSTQHIRYLPYASIMKRANCQETNSCLFHCSFQYNNEKNETNQINQTLFLTRPKSYALTNPNLQQAGIKQLSPLDYEITLTATSVALFVWLDIPGPNHTGYFSRNGFHMFQESTIVYFHAWKPFPTNGMEPNFDLRVTSLYDVFLP